MNIIYDKINGMRVNLITVTATVVGLGELARLNLKNGLHLYTYVFHIQVNQRTLQVYQNTRGISTNDKVTFLKKQMQAIYSDALLGRRLRGVSKPIDGGPPIVGEPINIGGSSFNPVRRVIPREMVRTNIPMIDVFNCLVK